VCLASICRTCDFTPRGTHKSLYGYNSHIYENYAVIPYWDILSSELSSLGQAPHIARHGRCRGLIL
jgi:hypothetical protein